MQSTALTSLLSALADVDREHPLTEAPLSSVSAAFAAIPDPRSRHGRRYDLPFLLTCLVAALLCGCDVFSDN